MDSAGRRSFYKKGREKKSEAKTAVMWKAAFEEWLETKSENTRRAYRQAWDDFIEVVGDKPWLVGGVGVMRWQYAMRDRGLAKSTISPRLMSSSIKESKPP